MSKYKQVFFLYLYKYFTMAALNVKKQATKKAVKKPRRTLPKKGSLHAIELAVKEAREKNLDLSFIK